MLLDAMPRESQLETWILLSSFKNLITDSLSMMTDGGQR